MAETNGSGRLDEHEERLGKLEAARKEREDALVVRAHLEARSASRIKEHAEYIFSLEEANKRHQEHIGFMRAADERHAIKRRSSTTNSTP